MAQNKEIKKELETGLDFEGELDTVISELERKKQHYKDSGYFKFHIEKYYGFAGHDESYVSFILTGIRFETDQELAKRLATSKKKSEANKKAAITKKTKKEAKELETYYKLRKKYEKYNGKCSRTQKI